LIIALGNALVGFSVVLLCEYVGAHHKWKQDVIALIIIVPCVMINIICDLYVTIRNVFTMWERDYPGTDLANDWGFIMGYGLQAINWHLYYLLIPGYVFVPYVGEPLATMLLPYWIGVWRVKSDPRIDSRMAERIMVGGDIDIINPPYCDIICCTATMFLTLMLPTSYQSTLFMWLWFFALFLYWLNRKRILRWHSHTEFNSRKVDIAEAHLWSFPLALLAAAWGQQLAWSTSNCRDDGMDLNTCTVAPLGWVFLVVHAVVHLLFTFLVLPLLDPPHKPNETNTYDEIVKPRPDNYRNTNPIEVLRSIHIKEYEDEIETAAQVIEEAEAMKSSAEAHIVALQQAEEQKAKLKDAVSHQVNVTTSNFSMELSKLLNRADRDPLTACLNKVNELDQQFASLLASKVNGTNGSNGAGFHIAIMIDSSKIHGPVAPDMASFGHFVPQAELAHNVTGTDGGGEAEGDVWVPPWPTADGPVALVEKNRCRVAVEKLQHKYNLNLEDLASGLGKQ